MHAGQVADSVSEQIYSNVSGLADVVLTTVSKLGIVDGKKTQAN